MINKTIVASVIALFLAISLTSACSCIYFENPKDKLDNAEYVFTGKVNEIKLSSSYANQEIQEVTIQVIEHYKPNAFPESVNIKVYATKDTGANCGYNFVKDQSYLIYGYIDQESQKLSTSSCMGNSLLSEAQKDISELNRLTNSTNQGNQIPEPNPTEPRESQENNLFVKFFVWLKNLFG